MILSTSARNSMENLAKGQLGLSSVKSQLLPGFITYFSDKKIIISRQKYYAKVRYLKKMLQEARFILLLKENISSLDFG